MNSRQSRIQTTMSEKFAGKCWAGKLVNVVDVIDCVGGKHKSVSQLIPKHSISVGKLIDGFITVHSVSTWTAVRMLLDEHVVPRQAHLFEDF